MDKQTAIASIEEMPQNFELHDLIERLIILDKIEKGQKDISEGRTVSHIEAKNRLGKWLK